MPELIITNVPVPHVERVPMTREKAVEILSDSCHRGITTHGPDFREACMLGIAALIAEQLNLER